MAIDAVIFDWGGTLTPWHTVDHTAGWRAYADVVYPGQPAVATEAAAVLVAAESARWAASRDQHVAFEFSAVLADAGMPWHDAAVAAYRRYWEPHTWTDQDAPELLTGLRSSGLRLGVLSSTSWPAAWHLEMLDRDGVLDAFHGTVWSSTLSWTKPHAEAFLAAMAAVGADDPARCVYVGDRLYDDVHGASSVGMRTILVPHSDIPPEQLVDVEARPDAVVQRLADVAGVVDQWRSGTG